MAKGIFCASTISVSDMLPANIATASGAEDDGELVGDDLPDRAQTTDERELALRAVRRHHDGDRPDRGDREDVEQAEVDVRGDDPGGDRDHREQQERRQQRDERREPGTPARPLRSGTMSSFWIGLMTSAIGWPMPWNRPAYIGPCRCMIREWILSIP